MVLLGKLSGRVGRRRKFFKIPGIAAAIPGISIWSFRNLPSVDRYADFENPMKHVFFSGLKFKIALNLIFILMAGMALIDFVVTITVQELLVRSETSQGYFFIHALERQNLIGLPSDPKAMAALDRAVRELLTESNFSGAVLVVSQTSPRSYGALPPVLQNELRQLAAEAIHTGGRVSRFAQRTWGVFWQQPRYLLISAPLTAGPRGATGIGLLYDLNRIYQPLRQSQKILVWYLLVNTIILTLIGLYRIGQITLKPLFRIVQRAESYSETEDTLFAPERTENEFALLSRALNQMLLRVTQDKNRLRTTVDALTEANRDLEKAQREVIRAEKLASIGRLSAGIAHEIGNPLGIILGYLDLLKQADLSRDERFDFIDRSEKEIDRIHAIIRQLLDISRTSPVEAMPLDVHAILRDMVRGFQLQPIMRNIQFTLELSAGAGPNPGRPPAAPPSVYQPVDQCAGCHLFQRGRHPRDDHHRQHHFLGQRPR